MGIFDASTSSGGSINSAKNFYDNQSWSLSNSYTNGAGATASSNSQAQLANANSANAWLQTAQYNAQQAQIQREWQEMMANTVYQRSVSDMKKAGINPILAAGMGLGTASVGSGATASMSTPEIFMGNSFADQTSASQSASSGHGEGESNGSSWQNSESGLATFITSMSSLLSGLIGNINSGININFALNGLKDIMDGKTYDDFVNSIDNAHTGNGKYDNYRKKVIENNKKEVGDSKFLKFLNGLQLKATGLTD